MSDSTFDPETFMHGEVEGAMEVRYTPCPEGEFEAFIEDCVAETAKTGDGPKPILNLTYSVQDEGVKKELDLEHPTVRQTLWLDLDDTGNLIFGANKNVRLGRVREAVGQNKDGEPWSPSMLKGAGPILIKVGHRHADDDNVYAEVQRVTST